MATRSKTPTPSTARSRAPARAARPRAKAQGTSEKQPAPQVQAAPTPKATERPRASQAAKPAKPVKAPKADKPEDKPKKAKLVRDSFTIPKPEYEAIAALKLRAAKLGQTPKKSELLRAGLKALAAMGDATFLASMAAVPSIKTGRPAA